MAACPSCGFTPCRCCGSLTELRHMDIRKTLVASLVPCVDHIRDLYTSLGARVYEVALIHTRWTGGERGVGSEEVISDVPLLPTPRVSDLSAVQYQTYSLGGVEQGAINVSEISPRYTEDELMGRLPQGGEIPLDQNFYWELRVPVSPGESGERRRFVPVSIPGLDPLRFQWMITLVRAQQDRSRSGSTRG